MCKGIFFLLSAIMLVNAKVEFDECVGKIKNFEVNTECASLLIAKALGTAIIAGSFTYKVPQIIKIINAGSGEGVTLFSTYAETLIFINFTMFSLHNNFPFTAYGEAVTILVQNAILLVLLWSYHKKGLTHPSHIAVAGAFIGYTAWLFSGFMVPALVWDCIMQVNILLSKSSLYNRCGRTQ